MRLSVIVPIYNMHAFIEDTVRCLRSQTVSDAEFIMIDDGSKDDTLEKLYSLVNGDSRFIIHPTENHGYGAACNTGIGMACGEYIAVYEPDDLLSDDFYEKLLAAATEHPSADIVCYNGFHRLENGKVRKLYTWDRRYTGKIIRRDDMKRFWRSHPSVFNAVYRRKFIHEKRIFFCETRGACYQDVPFKVSLYSAFPSILIVDESKYTYRVHSEQSISRPDTKINNVIKNWNIQFNYLDGDNRDNINFCLYKMTIQFYHLLKLCSEQQKKKIYCEILKYMDRITLLKLIFYKNTSIKEALQMTEIFIVLLTFGFKR